MPARPLDMPKPGEWSFQPAEVAQAFDAHVREQLPWYGLATGLVAHLARHYLPEGGVVIDVGCSTGNIGRALAPIISARYGRIVAFDPSAEMLNRYVGPGTPIISTAEDFDFAREGPDVIVAFLALMFVAPAHRARVLARMKTALRPGGALIVFDKLEPSPGYLGAACMRIAMHAKREAGAPADEIVAKELSLAGVQRPLAPKEIAGLAPVFRFGDFFGGVFERGPE